VILCFALLLGNAACLQVVAWVGMVATRTVEQGLPAAVESTFSGKRPCQMCRVVVALERQGDAARDPSPSMKKTMKIDLVQPVVAVLVHGWSEYTRQPFPVDQRMPRAPVVAPELPPPRRA
jgi:hypothetical protein